MRNSIKVVIIACALIQVIDCTNIKRKDRPEDSSELDTRSVGTKFLDVFKRFKIFGAKSSSTTTSKPDLKTMPRFTFATRSPPKLRVHGSDTTVGHFSFFSLKPGSRAGGFYPIDSPHAYPPVGSKCIVDISSLDERQPIYILNENLMSPRDELTLKTGETLTLDCGKGSVTMGTQKFSKYALMVCVDNDNFKINNVEVKFANVLCDKKVYGNSWILPAITNECRTVGGNKMSEVGFKTDSRDFPLYETCHYNTRLLYVKYTYLPVDTHRTSSRAVSSLRKSVRGSKDNFDENVEYLGDRMQGYYVGSHQKSQLRSIFESLDVTFDRGHLAARGDFYYPTHQFATFKYENVAPQWKTLNRGNWKKVEFHIRKTLNDLKSNAVIRVGTFEILMTGDRTPILLEKLPSLNRKNLPSTLDIPLWFFKAVKVNRNCIVFLGLNNPSAKITDIEDIKLCDNKCPNSYDFSSGYIACCEFRDVRLKINTLKISDCRGFLDSLLPSIL